MEKTIPGILLRRLDVKEQIRAGPLYLSKTSVHSTINNKLLKIKNMKTILKNKIYVLLVSIFSTVGAYAQNTFPANGSAGIGTLTPTSRLTIRDMSANGDNIAVIKNNTSMNLDIYSAYNGSDNLLTGSFGYGVRPSDDAWQIWEIGFNANWANLFTVLKSGNVGIGTDNPTQKLQINNGSLSLNLPLQNNNNGIIFRNSNGTATIWGDWGIQYIQEVGKPAGLNFWKPWANTAQSNGSGITANYILFLQDNGKVQIGDISTPGDYKLYVQQGILTERVKVAVNGSANWADYVFANDYELKPLAEVETFIKENKHLPGVLSAEEMVKEGNDLGATDATLLAKIEELTLYLIEQQKLIQAMRTELDLLKNK